MGKDEQLAVSLKCADVVLVMIPICFLATTHCAVFMCWWENSPTGTELAVVFMRYCWKIKRVTCKLQFAT